MKETEPKQVNSPYAFVGDVLIKLEDVTSVTRYTRLAEKVGGGKKGTPGFKARGGW